jgi:hypothetical protein
MRVASAVSSAPNNRAILSAASTVVAVPFQLLSQSCEVVVSTSLAPASVPITKPCKSS